MQKPAVGVGPLAGIRVIECCGIVAGPLSCGFLADMGCDVIKVEPNIFATFVEEADDPSQRLYLQVEDYAYLARIVKEILGIQSSG